MITIMKTSFTLSFIALALSHLTYAAGTDKKSSSCLSNVTLAASLGPYPVSIYEHEVKTSRPDPLAPTTQHRRLLITVYRPFLDNFTCPIEYQSHAQYIPAVVGDALVSLLPLNLSSSQNASKFFAPVQLLNCSRPVPSSSASGPLLLFSPGLGGTHHIYLSTLQAAASSGYTVVAIDHTYEAAAVVFPDGSVAYGNPSTLNGTIPINDLQNVRDADAVSVLDAIERGDVPGLGRYSNSSSSLVDQSGSTSPSSSPAVNQAKPLRAVMYGHSLGGSTAGNVALIDPRILAAINIDGTFFGPVANSTVRKPLFMMGSAPPDWQNFYANHVRGWKTWVHPNNTEHYGYTDLPQLVDLLGLRGTVVPSFLTGTIGSERLQEIVWRYTLQFFGYVLKGVRPELLVGPSGEFPDVEFFGHAEAAYAA